MATALGEQVHVAAALEPDAWLVQVDAGAGGGATLVLRTAQGESAGMRTIASDDCTALAQAFAFIVLAHFVELKLIEPSGAARAQPERAPPTPVVVAPPARTEPTPVARPPFVLSLGLGAGLGVGVAPSSAAPAADLAVAVGPHRAGWRARLGAQLAAPVQHASATDRVEHWRSGVRLELGGRLPFARAAWLEGGAGGGVTLARVTALDVPGEPATLRLWPAVTASAALGLGLAPGWSLRWATAAQLFPRTDRYLVEPAGEVAESPKADVVTTLGLQFDALL